MAPAAESNAFESDSPITGTIESLETIADILCFNPGMLELQLLRNLKLTCMQQLAAANAALQGQQQLLAVYSTVILLPGFPTGDIARARPWVTRPASGGWVFRLGC
jgi:hypothetical protein